MADKTKKDRSEGVKRFLTDFRSHTERRSFEERRAADRRDSSGSIDGERRRSDERRDAYDRREMLLDRRRGTSEVFVREHLGWIRDALLNAGTEVACPRCKGDLLLGPTTQRGDKLVREVHCTACRHRAVIVDVPDDSGDSQSVLEG
jgi:DNA-directed RNA polymerase subunit RPC12/RpoP